MILNREQHFHIRLDQIEKLTRFQIDLDLFVLFHDFNEAFLNEHSSNRILVDENTKMDRIYLLNKFSSLLYKYSLGKNV